MAIRDQDQETAAPGARAVAGTGTGAGELAPSEVVVLRAEEFAGKPGLYNDSAEAPDGHGKVSSSHLARAALAAAFLSMEAAGAVAFEERNERQGLIGHATTMYVKQGATPGATTWPEGSAEARIAAMVQGGPQELKAIVYALVGKRATDPDAQAVRAIEQGLAARGLLTEEKTRHLIFTGTRYHMTDAAAQLVAAHPAAPLKGLLDECQTSRADVWKLLEGGIKTGIALRAPSTD